VLRRNKVLSMLESKRLPLGIQCFTGNPALIEVIGVTGFDWIMLDTEHSGNDPRAIEDLVRTSQLAGLAAYVRVPDPRVPADIGRALEAGAEGVFLPQVASMEDIDMAASAAFFPPKGERGLCPSVRAAGYSVAGLVEYTEWSNREIAIVPMIENSDARRSSTTSAHIRTSTWWCADEATSPSRSARDRISKAPGPTRPTGNCSLRPSGTASR
jgi:2-keto-3-deoxy-L-rhamnonate aldolase RhmA